MGKQKKLKIESSIKAYLFQAVANNSFNHLRILSKEDKIEDYFKGVEHENIGFSELAYGLSDQSMLMQELSTRIMML